MLFLLASTHEGVWPVFST